MQEAQEAEYDQSMAGKAIDVFTDFITLYLRRIALNLLTKTLIPCVSNRLEKPMVARFMMTRGN